MARPRPRDQEALFEIHEMFFSRTDLRGVIQSGNEVFVRVSEYEASELLKAPHSLIRHPDMPRSVFKLFWQTIQSHKPIGAYVKNMTKSGAYYWVFAVAFPMGDGYISLRLKPSSSLFAKVPELYNEILRFEDKQGMEAGLELLLQKLSQLGFPSYEEFMTAALVEELHCRDVALAERKVSSNHSSHFFYREALRCNSKVQEEVRFIFSSLIRLRDSGRELQKSSQAILDCFSALDLISLNMSVGAARIGPEGTTLVGVSRGFKKMAEEVKATVESFQQSLDQVLKEITGSQFDMGSSRLQAEMIQTFLQESALAVKSDRQALSASFLENHRQLVSLCQKSLKQVQGSLSALLQTLGGLVTASEQLQTSISALEVIRMTGKIESAKLSGVNRQDFMIHIEKMSDFIHGLSGHLTSVRSSGERGAKETAGGERRLYQSMKSLQQMIDLESKLDSGDVQAEVAETVGEIATTATVAEVDLKPAA